MNLGAPELLILLIIPLAIAALTATILGGVRAARNGDTGWLVGIVVGWFFGFGWIVGLIYLLTVDRGRRSATTAYGSFDGSPARAPGGWHPDPSGRWELRYYDGVRWTEHVSRGGQQGTDPI